jgi:hypothetical protein
MEVYVANEVARRSAGRGRWIASGALKDTALPTVMRKLLEHGLVNIGRKSAKG